MADFMKPSVANPPKPTDTRQERGKTVNPPTYLDMGGFTGASKVKKAGRMRVEKPEKGGPFRKG
jgi:hypothetical protein